MYDIAATTNPGDISITIAIFGFIGLLLFAGMVLDIILLIHFRRKPPNSLDLTARLRSRPWTFQEGGTIFLILISLQVLLLAGITVAYRLDLISMEEDTPSLIIMQTLMFHGIALLLIIFFIRARGSTWQESFGLTRRDLLKHVRQGVIFCIATLPIVAFYSVAYNIFLMSIDYDLKPQGIIKILAEPYSVWLQAYLGILAIAAAPFAEELLFRGVALPALAKHFKILPAVYLVSLVFAVMHFHIQSIVPLFVLAVAFSLGYLYTGSIVVPMVMHFLFNTVNVLVLILIRNMPEISL